MLSFFVSDLRNVALREQTEIWHAIRQRLARIFLSKRLKSKVGAQNEIIEDNCLFLLLLGFSKYFNLFANNLFVSFTSKSYKSRIRANKLKMNRKSSIIHQQFLVIKINQKWLIDSPRWLKRRVRSARIQRASQKAQRSEKFWPSDRRRSAKDPVPLRAQRRTKLRLNLHRELVVPRRFR